MIITKIRGGLGNQFFTYAAGRALSLTNNDPLVLDTSWYWSGARPFLLNHFRIAGTVSPDDHSGASDGVGFNQIHWQYDPLFEHVDGSRFLSGRWQSERFFARHRFEIKRDLQFRDGTYAATAAARIQAIRGGLGNVRPLQEGRLSCLGCRRKV